MDFAADAVVDMIAPPPRVAKAAPQAARSDTSFDDHLDAASSEDVRAEPRAEKADAAPDACATEAPPTPSDVQQAPDASAAPVLVQLIASAPPIAPTPPSVETNAPALEAAAPLPALAPELPIEAPAQADGAEAESGEPPAPAAAHAKDKSAPAENKAAFPVADAPASVSAPQTASIEVAPPQAAAAQVAQAATPDANSAAAALAAVAPAQPDTPRETAQRVAKGEPASASAKVESGDVKTTPRTERAPTQKNAGGKAEFNAGGKENSAAPAHAAAADMEAPAQAAAPTLQTATQTQQTALDHNVARAAPASAQVAREIVRRFNGGSTQFDLRLDPAELGRVDVRLEVSRDHRVTAVVSADNPQALAELSRNARELEQMLQSAGLELSDSGLSFDLRQGDRDGDAQLDEAGSRARGGGEDLQQDPILAARPIGIDRWRGVRVDVTV